MNAVGSEVSGPGRGAEPCRAPREAPPAEVAEVHTRLLKCALCVDESRAYWLQSQGRPAESDGTRAALAFEQSWFGVKSMPWVTVLVNNLRLRFDAYPEALAVLGQWREMSPDIRRLICHWHLQLTDPLYRAFTGQYLVRRRESLRASVDRHTVIRWVEDQGPGRWTVSTRTQFGTRLLSCAREAGLVVGRKDPRELVFPRVPDDALAYLLHLLRAVRFAGTMLENPYLASVGLVGGALADRLRTLEAVHYTRVGDLHDFEWPAEDLTAWAEQSVLRGRA
jgi:hypothetical protein